MTSAQLNPFTWHSTRELRFTPSHFVVVSKIITSESFQWILEKQTGRFSLIECPNYSMEHDLLEYYGYFPGFEDPAEAIHFQLVWS